MKQYTVVHSRKAEEVLVDALNTHARQGWRLVHMFEKPNAFMLVLEREVSEPIPLVEDLPAPVRKTRNKPILVTSEKEQQ